MAGWASPIGFRREQDRRLDRLISAGAGVSGTAHCFRRASRKRRHEADPASDELIGEIGLVGISWPNRRAGVSILVLPGSRRAGVGREAIELLVGWAHRELGLHRIQLHTLPENTPMQRLAEASGFVREGVLRDYTFERGRFVDNVVYARLPA
jgi:RimJ/RimL family protein N-acetyltransferase